MNPIKERLFNEIEVLNDSNLLYLLDYARKLNNGENKQINKNKFNNKTIMKLLNKIKGDISDDILDLRDDRV